MRRFFLLSIALVVFSLSSACVVAVREPAPIPAPVPAPLPPIDPTVGYFYDALDPWGDWVWSDSWGWVWTPGSVPGSWSPYHDGRWIWTADGWYWLSEEPWAWATYHYGRWAWVPRWGWVWVPGETWAPAWVAWRWGGGWAGWAPLPPEVVWMDGRLSWSGDLDVWIDVDWWCFVQEVHVVEPRVYRYAVPVGRNVTLIRTTKDRTRYLRERDRIVNRGVEVDEVRRAVRKDVPTWRITDVSSPRDAGRTVEARREVQAWRPHLEPPRKDARPEKPANGRISREDTERDARRRAVPAAPRREEEVRAPVAPPSPPQTPARPGRVERPRAIEPDVDAERERLARYPATERERLERQQAEEARKVRDEQERKARADREAADARMRAERAEQDRIDRERAAEARRASDEAQRRAIEERTAEERRARESAVAKERADQQRTEEARRIRAEAERKALEDRQAEERRVQRERAEQEQRALEERARREAERAERAQRERPKKEEPEEKKEEPPPDRKRAPR